MRLPEPTLTDSDLREAARHLIGGDGSGLSAPGALRLLPADRPGHGDLATAAAWPLARASGRPAASVAEDLAQALRSLPAVARATPAGPGLVNLTLHDAALEGLATALAGLADAPPGPAMVFPLDRLRLEDAGFLLQHVHARCRWLLRAAESGLQAGTVSWRDVLAEAAGQPAARALMLQLDHALRALAQQPTGAGEGPLRGSLLRLAQASLRLWKAPADDATMTTRMAAPESLRFESLRLQPQRLVTLGLARATATVIRAGLEQLGEDAAEEIR